MARAYGWDENGSLVNTEVEELQAMAEAIADGTPVRRVVADLNARGVQTVMGGQWAPITVTRALTNPRMVGKRRQQDGVLVATGAPAALSDDLWVRVQAVLTDPARKRFAPKTAQRRMLLSGGLARCGRCGKNLHATGGAYACAKRYGGCAGITITANLLDTEVVERVLARLTDDEWRAALHHGLAHTAAEYREHAQAARWRMKELAEVFGAGEAERNALEAGVQAARAAELDAETLAQRAEVAALLPKPTAGAVVAWWMGLPVGTQREVVSLVLNHVAVAPKRGRKDTADRLTFTWS